MDVCKLWHSVCDVVTSEDESLVRNFFACVTLHRIAGIEFFSILVLQHTFTWGFRTVFMCILCWLLYFYTAVNYGTNYLYYYRGTNEAVKQAHQLLSSLQQDPTKEITQLLQQLKVSSSSSSSATKQQNITTLALPTSYWLDPATLHP